MKGRWKWVLLAIGILLISATCGFGYETKRTRSQFEEAEDAFSHRDWDRMVQALPDRSGPFDAPKPVMDKFLNTYITPLLEKRHPDLKKQSSPSTVVPIPNEEMFYEWRKGERHISVIRLSYVDQLSTFTLPFSSSRYYMFQGKQIRFTFWLAFYRACYAEFPPASRWLTRQSIIAFIRKERTNLDAMGMKPSYLVSTAKTWDEYIKSMSVPINQPSRL